MAEKIQRIPVSLTPAQVDELLTEKELLYGIYRAVSTIRTILVTAVVLSVIGVILTLASASESGL